ncbi:endoglucanase C307 precursor [mine drainage metagenome]|uniref:Endoglucanase C307 n=1 Tax=mine drainage metagenome TaxID=410659 RepID=A0A1J5TCD2_9ZZZZ
MSHPPLSRRRFLGVSAAAAGLLAGARLNLTAAESQVVASPKIPRWRGFNLTEMTGGHRGQRFHERDFEWMADWGFTFARIPMSYWCWSSPENWMQIDESAFAPLDEAIAFGKRHGIHLNLNLHRIPGYCVNGREKEPYQLFDSPHDSMERALEAAVHHWTFIARRYQHLPSTQVSFDLFNEPPWMKDQTRYVEIATRLVAAIRSVNPDRIIFADGADIGQTPVMGLAHMGLVQSTRGYLPKMISHYTATWVPPAEFESTATPTWPMRDKTGRLWDRETLWQELYLKWKPLVDLGVPVHVGEWGCFNHTPREAMMGWMHDILSVWKEAGWGWAMWNLRGAFGVVDSARPGTRYETFQGHQLDREMLELLRAN